MKGINPKLKLHCPRWYSRIRRTRDENKRSLLNLDKFGTNLRNGSMCVVGELHGWSTDYSTQDGGYCGDCQEFATALYTFAWDGPSVDDFRIQVNLLVDHIEKDHPEIVERVSQNYLIPNMQ